MYIVPNDLKLIFSEYIDNIIAPKANGMQKFGAYTMLFILNNKMDTIIQQYSPIMKMSGVMNEEGNIDLEYTHTMFSEVSSKSGKVNIMGYNMDNSDIESIYSIAIKYGR